MESSLLLQKYTWLVLCFMICSTAALAQLPQCDRLYMDQIDALTYTSSQRIYTYNPGQPVSPNNPGLNAIQMPADNVGLTVSEVLGSGNTTLTFYTVVNDQYWYYDPNTLVWVNTQHYTGSGGSAVNLASGGGMIYNLVGMTGAVYKYDGSGNGSLLTTLANFSNEGPYDIIADCAGNFYVLNATGISTTPSLRKYDANGALVQTWAVNNPNGYTPSGGFGIIGTEIYMDNVDFSTSNIMGIASGGIGSTITNITHTTDTFSCYDGFLIGDLGSCASSAPVLPDITVAASDTTISYGTTVTFSTAIHSGGNTPSYQWHVNGFSVTGATDPTYSYNPYPDDVVTCKLTSSIACAVVLTVQSNPITITVENCTLPALQFNPKKFCPENGEVIPVYSPEGGIFSADAGAMVNNLTGAVDVSRSTSGAHVVTYLMPANATCPLLRVRDTITIAPARPVAIAMDVDGNRLCQNETVTLHTQEATGNSYQWTPESYFPSGNDSANVTATIVSPGTIYLTVKNPETCEGRDSIVLHPEHCCYVMIPTAFSPNGDGLNDVFKINSNAIQEVNQLSIYNRVGERVFSSNEQTKGWDGTYRNQLADAGVYHYMLIYTCSNGEKFTKKGALSLIR